MVIGQTFQLVLKKKSLRILLGELSYGVTVAVCISQKMTVFAHMMSLSCFLFIKMLYIYNFSFANTLSDQSLERATKVFALSTSLLANLADSVYKVKCSQMGNVFSFSQALQSQSQVGQYPLYTLLGGPKMAASREGGANGISVVNLISVSVTLLLYGIFVLYRYFK